MRPYFRYVLYIFSFPIRFVFFSVAFFRVELLMNKGACVIPLIDPIHSDYLTIIRQCLLRGYSHKDAYVVAEILSAKTAYRLRGNTDYNALFTAVDDPKWEVN